MLTLSTHTVIAVIAGLLVVIAFLLYNILKVLDLISGLLHSTRNSEEIIYVFRQIKENARIDDL